LALASTTPVRCGWEGVEVDVIFPELQQLGWWLIPLVELLR
jgi:hypothetical protein